MAVIEYAIAAQSYSNAREGLAKLRATTVRLADAGDIKPFRAPEILVAVEELDLLLGRLEADR